MFFGINESNAATVDDGLEQLLNKDPDTEVGLNNIANDVENLMQQAALESVNYFENGEDALKHFRESAEVKALVESRKMSKKTFVRLGKQDDLTRRAHLASIIIAKEKNDPLFHQLALNRVRERKLRTAIFKKYETKANAVAKKSQKEHIKAMRTMPSLPKVSFA